VIVRGADQSTQEVISTWSQESDLSLLGLRIPAHLEDAEYSRRVDRLMAQMGSVLLVRSAQNEDILDVDQ
ncbi:MAG: hypothetical protein KDE20_18130, partial [Caldilineaceae bacterium]|nr:hypothetical protein [Caldilineaceae bacterium]